MSVTDPNWSPTGGGPGDVFVASKGYQQIQDPAGRGQQWSTGPVEVAKGMPHTLLKGTLLETAGGAGPGGGLVPPQYAPGIVDKLFEPLGVADVFGQSTVNTSHARYVVEGTATNAAAGVAEAAAKPESTLGYTETTEAIRKIATVLPISDEMLEDAPSIQSYLNGRLSLFVKVEEERQLVRGRRGRVERAARDHGRRPRDQWLYEAGRGRQLGCAGEGDRQHRRVELRPAGHDHPKRGLDVRASDDLTTILRTKPQLDAVVRRLIHFDPAPADVRERTPSKNGPAGASDSGQDGVTATSTR